MTDENKIAILILAAGSSSRLGTSKQLLQVNSEPLLIKVVNSSLATPVNKVFVVLGSNKEEHQKIIDSLPVEIIVNQEWKNGMGNSIKAGIRSIISYGNFSGVVILVCDQPYLNTQHINKLIESHDKTKKGIVASWYANSPGVPAYFDNSFFEKILQIHDEQGAKMIFTQYVDQVTYVDFPEGVIDIDTMEDYRNVLNNNPE